MTGYEPDMHEAKRSCNSRTTASLTFMACDDRMRAIIIMSSHIYV